MLDLVLINYVLLLLLVKFIMELFLLMNVLFILLLNDIRYGVEVKGDRILLKVNVKCNVLKKELFFEFYIIIRLVLLFIKRKKLSDVYFKIFRLNEIMVL